MNKGLPLNKRKGQRKLSHPQTPQTRLIFESEFPHFAISTRQCTIIITNNESLVVELVYSPTHSLIFSDGYLAANPGLSVV